MERNRPCGKKVGLNSVDKIGIEYHIPKIVKSNKISEVSPVLKGLDEFNSISKYRNQEKKHPIKDPDIPGRCPVAPGLPKKKPCKPQDPPPPGSPRRKDPPLPGASVSCPQGNKSGGKI